MSVVADAATRVTEWGAWRHI